MRVSFTVCQGAFLALLAIQSAHAAPLNARTYVSGLGNDLSPCSAYLPCRTLAGALTKTSAGGEVHVLNSADYGSVNIDKSVTITSEGAAAGVLATHGTAITINANASDVVSFRGLEIDGGTTGTTGIQFNSGHSLIIQKTVVRGFSGAGIVIAPSGAASFLISDTLVSNVAGNGIAVSSSNSIVSGTFNRVTASGNGSGIYAVGAKTSLALTDGVINNNSYGLAASAATVMVRNSTINNNVVGVQADQSGIIRIGQSVVTTNGTGVLYANGGQVVSFQNNSITGNGTDGTLTSVLAQQ